MKSLTSLVVLLFLLVPVAHGQTRPAAKAGSAEAASRIEAYRDRLAAGTPGPAGVLSVPALKVGAQGRPDRLSMKVFQVLDPMNMLVGVEDPRGGDSKYRTQLLLKGFPTAGITDGAFYGTGWDGIIGKGAQLKVTGTKALKLSGGGSKTVFVLEAVVTAKPGTSTPTPAPTRPTKAGAAAYDDYPEPVRSKLVKDWQGELDALKRAILDDKDRLTRATTAAERTKLTNYIKGYTEKLAKHEKNDPPYLVK